MLFSTSTAKSWRSMAVGASTHWRWCRVGLAAAAVTCLAGCPNIERDLEDFEARQAANPPPKVEVACGEAATEVEGTFLFAMATELGPTKPLVFLTEVTTEADGLSFTFQPLAAADRKTPVGDPITVGGYAITEEGTFEADLPVLKVPGLGNPITGTDIEADVALEGAVCADALCGGFIGKVLKPITYDLTPGKNTFYMERVPDGEDPPAQPFLDCDAKKIADPPPGE